MEHVAKDMLFNCFEGTSPKEPVLGEIYEKVVIKKLKTARKAAKSGQGIPLILNGYSKVSNLIPENTDIAHDILSVNALINILRDPGFETTLQKIYDNDPAVLHLIISPRPSGVSRESSPVGSMVNSGLNSSRTFKRQST